MPKCAQRLRLSAVTVFAGALTDGQARCVRLTESRAASTAQRLKPDAKWGLPGTRGLVRLPHTVLARANGLQWVRPNNHSTLPKPTFGCPSKSGLLGEKHWEYGGTVRRNPLLFRFHRIIGNVCDTIVRFLMEPPDKRGIMENESQTARSGTNIPRSGLSREPRKAPHSEHPINRFNRRLAVLITKSVGSMWCAYAFALLAFVSFPAAISSHDPFIIISWIAQTFLQLVLLPIIIVGQNVQAASDEARAQSDHEMLLAVRALSLLQLGEQQLAARNIQSALRTYQEAYALDPDNPATSYYLGCLYTETRQIDKGIEHLKLALTQNEQYPPAEAALAYALRLQADKLPESVVKHQRYAESEQMFLRALSQDPTVRDINGESFHAVLGGLYKRLNRMDEAIEAYKAAELVTPQNSYPIVNLATLYYLRGDLEQAKQYYERSVAISSRIMEHNPFDYWTRFDLSAAQLVLGNLEQAKWQFSLAVQHVRHIGPLETFLHDLERLKNAPTSPRGVDELVDLAQNAIRRSTSGGKNGDKKAGTT